MPHYTPLISTIVVALVLAFIFGVLAQRLRFSPLVGYLLAGIVISPFTPGYVADQGLANELIESSVPANTGGSVQRRQRLGGLLSYYHRVAA